MEGPTVVVDADKIEFQELCRALEGYNYQTIAMDTLKYLAREKSRKGLQGIITDLYTISADNRFIL
jgi:hypothetical protein